MRLPHALFLLPATVCAAAFAQTFPLSLLRRSPTPGSARRPCTIPATARGDVVEEQFGEQVADPYRWLENDVREDPRVRDWVTAQNQVTNAFLAHAAGAATRSARG